MAGTAKRGKLRHIEVEHKYVVGPTFDAGKLRNRLRGLNCLKDFSVSVRDDYYWSSKFPTSILRHRFDEQLQQLTLKTRGLAADARTEVNLGLDHNGGDQRDGVGAFLGNLTDFQRVTIQKSVTIFLFRDCEICFYAAKCGRKKIRCVEFEAIRKTTLKAARDTIKKYEDAAGFGREKREGRSLFEMLVVPALKNKRSTTSPKKSSSYFSKRDKSQRKDQQ